MSTTTAAAPTTVGPRIDITAFDGIQGMYRINRAVAASALEPALRHLVKTRASQINGCGYCLDMHSKDALAEGEDPQRLHVLPAWREAPCYSDRERAALALTESVTRIADAHAPEALLDEVRAQFDDDEVAALLFLIVEINAWNRLAITSGIPVGSYQRDAGR